MSFLKLIYMGNSDVLLSTIVKNAAMLEVYLLQRYNVLNFALKPKYMVYK